jgi:lysozyme
LGERRSGGAVQLPSGDGLDNLSADRQTTGAALSTVRTFGIDISSDLEPPNHIDWRKVILGLDPKFVLARAFHVGADAATTTKDGLFASEYWPALAQLNMPRGAYLFCHPVADPGNAITNFFDQYTPQRGDLLPTLDIEDIWDNSINHLVPLTQRLSKIDAMVRAVAAKIGGQMPMIYTKARVWNDLGNPTQFSGCPLWVMDYQTNPTQPTLPASWPNYAFWQYAENLKVDGIEKDYDPDIFNGPVSGLDAYRIR